MVAAQVLTCLWAATTLSLAVAAPQLDFGDERSASYRPNIRTPALAPAPAPAPDNENIVSEVLLALQPTIQQAVAAALAKQSRPAAPAVTSAQVSAGGDSGAEDNSATAEYSYEYKVSDKEQSTFISKQENRAGDTLTGSYSYVDPNGDLITVNYEAGAMGFSATTDKQEGFLAPVRNSVSTSTASDYKTTSSAGLASSSAAVDQEALIARVLAALQPQISSAVAAAVSSSASAASAPRGRSLARVPGAGASVESTFGEGISVSIDTPDFNIAY